MCGGARHVDSWPLCAAVAPLRLTSPKPSARCVASPRPAHASVPPLCVAARDAIRADVYAYWLQRRKAQQRPLLRRLMAPTPINDQNPYNVFRCGGAMLVPI